MKRVNKVHGRLAYPGQPLAVIEEFIPGEGVYVENGTIYSAHLGVVDIDTTTRRLNVKPLTRTPRVPRKGDIVHGYISSIPRDDIALIKITHDEHMIPFTGTYTGILHISQAADRHPSTIHDYVRLGDVVRVQVLNNSNPYIVSIKQATLGVIAAFCSRCGAPLYRVHGQPYLVCLQCGNRETRKVAAGYIYVKKGG